MKKYIQDSVLLTKEAFEQYIQQQCEAQAAQYGLTLEEYNQAIMNGSVVEAKSPSDLPSKQQVMFIYYFIISGLIMGIWMSYRQYQTSDISVLDVLLNLVGFMLIGWLMLPITLIALLDNIKLK